MCMDDVRIAREEKSRSVRQAVGNGTLEAVLPANADRVGVTIALTASDVSAWATLGVGATDATHLAFAGVAPGHPADRATLAQVGSNLKGQLHVYAVGGDVTVVVTEAFLDRQ